MENAYDLAALAVRQRLAEQRPERLAALDAIRRADVVVFSGAHDSVQNVLRRLRVPFALDPPAKDLARARIVFANCTSIPHDVLRTRAADFVSDGGWLVSTDWSLQCVVEPSFPGTVQRKTGRSSADEVVAVEPDINSLWAEVAVSGADPQWWLESSSYPIEIVNPDRVHIEAASHELLVRYDAPAVSVRFDWHDGHVFHVISHLWLKRTRTPERPRYAGPCVNFLRDGMRLTEAGIDAVLSAGKATPDTFNFATIQSAATSTELVAQLCIEALGTVPPLPKRATRRAEVEYGQNME